MPMARTGEGLEEFMPLADIVERDKEYLIKLDLPEVPKEDVKVLFDDGVLTIRASARSRRKRRATRCIAPSAITACSSAASCCPRTWTSKAIRAESKEGVLTIHMPRVAVEKARPLAITIQ